MSNGKRKSEAFDTQIARKNGLETGDYFVLPKARYIKAMLEADDSYTLFVREVKILNGSLSKITETAKLTETPNDNSKTSFVPVRDWDLEKTGQSIITLMQGEDINHYSVEGEDTNRFVPVDRAERRAFNQRISHLPPAEQRRLFEERFPNA